MQSPDDEPPAGGSEPDNPFEAPESLLGQGALRGSIPVDPSTWTPTDAIQFGWRRLRQEPMVIPTLLVAMILSGLLTIVGVFAALPLRMSHRQEDVLLSLAIQYGAQFLSLFLQAYFVAGVSRYILAVGRGESPPLGLIFSGGRYGTCLGATLLYTLGGMIGGLCCVLPGIVLQFAWGFYGLLIVERQAGAIESLVESWRLWSGNWGNFALLVVLFVLVQMAGVACCGVGVFVSTPIVFLAMVYAYLMLTGEGVEMPQ